VEDQYADLADDYDWLVSDELRDNSRLLGTFGELLEAGPGAVDVLDCACGIGWNAIDLARRGYRVSASDGSGAMVAQARQNALRAGVPVDIRVGRWDVLPTVWKERFGLVFCVGNSLVHANADDGLTQALRGIRAILTPGGRLALDSRDWESGQWTPGRHVRVAPRAELRGGRRGIVVRTWDVPASIDDEYWTDIVLILEDAAGQLSHRVHTIRFRPFTCRALEQALSRAGFVRWDITAGDGWLNVVAS
jgi:glycine/sarcosine N-methyltransferase